MLRLFSISVALYIVIICGGYIFLYLHGYVGPDFFERTPPEIEVIQEPKGIGLLPTRFQFLVRDSGAGLDEVVVRAQQAKRKLDIFSQYYHEKNKEDRISIDISGKEQGLREGSVAISILAFDKGFFNNKASKILELPVDYRKPRLEVLSPQHNVNQGGVEFAFYKLADGTAVKSGIKTGGLVFRGYPAKLLDPGFESMPEVYFSFFAVPTVFRVGEEKILAFATNAVANTSLAEFYYRIIPRRFRSEEVNLKEYFVRTKLEELLDHLGGNPEDVPMNVEELSNAFAGIVEKLHLSEDKELFKFSTSSLEKQLWQVPFQRPIGGVVRNSFGTTQRFLLEGTEAVTYQHTGMDLAATLRNSVFSANDGYVKYAGYFGTYGNTVIIDHGFGLLSFYGHLSSISVKVGTMVQKGVELGRTGSSGLAEGDHLHFEMRLQGVPVNPIEWFDTRWINDHIIAKRHQMLGQASAQPEEEIE